MEGNGRTDIESGGMERTAALRLGFRIITILTGVLAAILGLVNLFQSRFLWGIILSLYQILLGLMVIVIETQFFNRAPRLENIPLWAKGVGYFAIPIPPTFLHFTYNGFFGCIWIMVIGIIYGIAAILERRGKTLPFVTGGG